MKINLKVVLKDVDTKPLKEKDKVVTLKDVCVAAVLTPNQKDDQKTKMEKWDIYKKLRDSEEECDLQVEEIAVIKTAIGEIYPPLIMGQCFDLIESYGKA